MNRGRRNLYMQNNLHGHHNNGEELKQNVNNNQQSKLQEL